MKQPLLRVSALFLINETATVIDPCINIRTTDTYYYIYVAFLSVPQLIFLVYTVEFTRNDRN